jgi:hypothetical protein
MIVDNPHRAGFVIMLNIDSIPDITIGCIDPLYTETYQMGRILGDDLFYPAGI